jgi:DNA helicase-2/ATP-dependent DNA helicase PcrA
MKADMVRNNVDVSNLSLDDLGIYASPQHALKLSSLHNAKGREYSAVAMIDVHEGKIPHYMSKKTHEIEEAKRLFYVGITRAKRVLLYITDDTERRNGPTRFLDIVPTKMT